jgi:probable blue pigment (indigoidine) exporter
MMNMKGSSRMAALTTVLAPISWGTTYLVVTELLPAGRPLLVASMRVVPAGALLVGVARLRSRWRPHGREWGLTALLALFNFGIFFPLLVVAVQRLPGGTAAAVGGLQPLLVAGLSRVGSGRRPGRAEAVVGLVAAIGVALVVMRPGAGLDVVGVVAAVVANVSFATGIVLTKRFPPPPTDHLAATGWQLLVGGALLVPLMLIVEGPPPALDERALVGFAYLSVVATGLAFVVWFAGIRRLPASAPPLLGLAAPVTGAALGWIAKGEALSPVQLVGFAITLGAIAHGARLGASAGARGAGLTPHRPQRGPARRAHLGAHLEPEPLVQRPAARARRFEVGGCPGRVGCGQRVGEERAAEPPALGHR